MGVKVTDCEVKAKYLSEAYKAMPTRPLSMPGKVNPRVKQYTQLEGVLSPLENERMPRRMESKLGAAFEDDLHVGISHKDSHVRIRGCTAKPPLVEDTFEHVGISTILQNVTWALLNFRQNFCGPRRIAGLKGDAASQTATPALRKFRVEVRQVTSQRAARRQATPQQEDGEQVDVIGDLDLLPTLDDLPPAQLTSEEQGDLPAAGAITAPDYPTAAGAPAWALLRQCRDKPQAMIPQKPEGDAPAKGKRPVFAGVRLQTGKFRSAPARLLVSNQWTSIV